MLDLRSVRVDLRLIGVQAIKVLVFVQRAGDDLERVARELIIIVEEGDISPGRQAGGGVRGAGDAFVLREIGDFDEWRAAAEQVQNRERISRRRCVIGDA